MLRRAYHGRVNKQSKGRVITAATAASSLASPDGRKGWSIAKAWRARWVMAMAKYVPKKTDRVRRAAPMRSRGCCAVTLLHNSTARIRFNYVCASLCEFLWYRNWPCMPMIRSLGVRKSGSLVIASKRTHFMRWLNQRSARSPATFLCDLLGNLIV